MLQVQSFVFNPLQENTYILFDDTNSCVIVDPGCYEKHEEEELSQFITDNRLSVKAVVNTHCHIDHILGNYALKERYKVPLLIPEKELVVLQSGKVYAPAYGFHRYQEASADRYLTEADQLEIGGTKLSILFVPGHSPGHLAFYDAESAVLIAGDVLFYNSIGRTDLPGGNYSTLIESIHKKLFQLPDNTVVYPGHGPETTIGFEKRTNPFCAVA